MDAARAAHTATPLVDGTGKVIEDLVVGGAGTDDKSTSTAEIFQQQGRGRWVRSDSRYRAIRVAAGRVLASARELHLLEQRLPTRVAV